MNVSKLKKADKSLYYYLRNTLEFNCCHGYNERIKPLYPMDKIVLKEVSGDLTALVSTFRDNSISADDIQKMTMVELHRFLFDKASIKVLLQFKSVKHKPGFNNIVIVKCVVEYYKPQAGKNIFDFQVERINPAASLFTVDSIYEDHPLFAYVQLENIERHVKTLVYHLMNCKGA